MIAVVETDDDRNFVHVAQYGNGRKMFFKVYSIIQKNGLLWIAVRKLPIVTGDRHYIIDDSGPIKVMQLTPAMRHVAYMHVCSDQ